MIDAQKWYTVVGADSGIPQYYTYSATNLRLQEASVSYTIPRKKLKNIMDDYIDGKQPSIKLVILHDFANELANILALYESTNDAKVFVDEEENSL